MQEITREELLELVNVEKNDGEWRVLNVLGDVDGRVCGNVCGSVEGNIKGSVCGDVEGDVLGDIEGDVLGDVLGSVWGSEEDKAVRQMAKIVGYPGSQLVLENCRKLYAAGYRKQPAEDMTDPANWRAGDLLVCVCGTCNLTVGEAYRVIAVDSDGDFIIDDDADCGVVRRPYYFRFHSRP